MHVMNVQKKHSCALHSTAQKLELKLWLSLIPICMWRYNAYRCAELNTRNWSELSNNLCHISPHHALSNMWHYQKFTLQLDDKYNIQAPLTFTNCIFLILVILRFANTDASCSNVMEEGFHVHLNLRWGFVISELHRPFQSSLGATNSLPLKFLNVHLLFHTLTFTSDSDINHAFPFSLHERLNHTTFFSSATTTPKPPIHPYMLLEKSIFNCFILTTKTKSFGLKPFEQLLIHVKGVVDCFVDGCLSAQSVHRGCSLTMGEVVIIMVEK